MAKLPPTTQTATPTRSADNKLEAFKRFETFLKGEKLYIVGCSFVFKTFIQIHKNKEKTCTYDAETGAFLFLYSFLSSNPDAPVLLLVDPDGGPARQGEEALVRQVLQGVLVHLAGDHLQKEMDLKFVFDMCKSIKSLTRSELSLRSIHVLV